MAESFTMFAKFGDVCEALEEQDRRDLVYALAMYGMYGEVIELPYNLKPIFIALREDIDNSKASRKSGSDGGRKSSRRGVKNVSATSGARDSDALETSGETGLTKGSHDEVTPLTQCAEQEVTPLTCDSEKKVSQTNPIQTNTEQTKRERHMGRMARPTVEEVRAYCDEKGYRDVDPQQFVDYYDSVGWVVGKSRKPMRSWKGAIGSMWHGRDKPGGEADEYSRL